MQFFKNLIHNRFLNFKLYILNKFCVVHIKLHCKFDDFLKFYLHALHITDI